MEFDFTLSLNLKCEEILDNRGPIMEQSNAKLDIRELLKCVEFNSLSNASKLIIQVLFIIPFPTKKCPKNVIKSHDPRCTSVTHETPILKFWALS